MNSIAGANVVSKLSTKMITHETAIVSVEHKPVGLKQRSNAICILPDLNTTPTATTITGFNSKRCRLLELPQELRDEIYRYSLSCNIIINLVDEFPRADPVAAACALSRTCKQIYQESRGIFYKSSTVCLKFEGLATRVPVKPWDKLSAFAASILAREKKCQSQYRLPVELHLGTFEQSWERWLGCWWHVARFLAKFPNVTVAFDYKMEGNSIVRFAFSPSSTASIVDGMSVGVTADGDHAILTTEDHTRLNEMVSLVILRMDQAREHLPAIRSKNRLR